MNTFYKRQAFTIFQVIEKLITIFLFLTSSFLLTSCQTNSNDAKEIKDLTTTSPTNQIIITMSWFGNDQQHQAILSAIEKYEELNPNIDIQFTYGGSTGWKDYILNSYSSKTLPDMNLICWNWIDSLCSLDPTNTPFLNLESLSDSFDLTSFSKEALEACTISNTLQALPVSFTGYSFYWNKDTFSDAGLSTPKSLSDLLNAGPIFLEKLGKRYYPLVLNEYERMCFLIYYLQSVYGKPWIINNVLQYTTDEITEGLDFIQSLEEHHVIPTLDIINKIAPVVSSSEWKNGQFAGIFETDSNSVYYKQALETNSFVLGNYFEDIGTHQGGFVKVNYALAISKTATYPDECAKLIQFLLNEPSGIELMGTEYGIPASNTAIELLKKKKQIKKDILKHHNVILSNSPFVMSTNFENTTLTNTSGTYNTIMRDLSNKSTSTKEAAELLVNDISNILHK